MATFAQHAATIEGFVVRVPGAAEAAANAMADVFRPAVQAVLTARSHGFSTKTPSAPGTPPAAISGALAASMMNEPAVMTGPADAMARSGPTTRYSRIQELGGPMVAHSPRGMRWQEPPGVWHRSMAHSLPARPYMKPTLETQASDGTLRDAAAGAFVPAAGL